MDLTGAHWRKSSRSGVNGGACVEIAAVWRKSSRSGTNGGNCIEVAGASRTVAVRDSKNPDGPKLAFAGRGWASFTGSIKAGTFDCS